MSARASWMHLDLDAFFASVEQKLNPKLVGKPVLIGRVDPQGRSVPRGVVATGSYEARAFGCRSGMPLFQALRLCPQAAVVGGHFEEYIKDSKSVFSICRRYAPKIQQSGIDEAFLDFSRTELIYPDLIEIARKIKEEIKKEVGITASIGLAATKVCAKVTSDFQKPDGLTFIPAGSEAKFLAPLSLMDLPGVNTKTYEKIHNLLLSINKMAANRVITIGDLARLLGSFVEERLGKTGLSLWYAANGIDTLWFELRTEVKSISRSQTFEKNSSDLKFILAKLQKLSEEVGEEARREGYFGRLAHVAIRYQDFRTASRQRVLPYPTALTKEIYDMGEVLLKELWDGYTPLRLVGIGISRFGELTQPSLFDKSRCRRLELEKRIDNLREKFGKESVISAVLIGLDDL